MLWQYEVSDEEKGEIYDLGLYKKQSQINEQHFSNNGFNISV